MWLALTLVCAAPFAHGTWVYKRGGLDATRLATLTAAPARVGLNEVYVSVEALSLDAPSTPAKLRQLKAAGLRVEALIDGENPERWMARIEAFNQQQADAQSRFDGIHYDFEPWIGTGSSNAWVDKTVAMYARARAALAKSPLGFTVDVSGVKLAALAEPDLQRLQQAVPRLILMQYQTPAERVAPRSETVMRGSADRGAAMLIAVRFKDFACDTVAVVQRLEAAESNNPRYAGWAIYDYEEYDARCRGSAR